MRHLRVFIVCDDPSHARDKIAQFGHIFKSKSHVAVLAPCPVGVSYPVTYLEVGRSVFSPAAVVKGDLTA